MRRVILMLRFFFSLLFMDYPFDRGCHNQKPFYKGGFHDQVRQFLENSFKNASLGVLKPKIFLGVLLIFVQTLSISSSPIVFMLIVLGRNCLILPFVFSLVPFSQGLLVL